MLTDDRDVRIGHDDVPAWARPPAAAPQGGSVARGVAVRLVGAGAVATALALLGHVPGAVILVVVLGVSSVLSLKVPPVGRAIDTGIGRFQQFVGRGLAFVFLGLIHLVVFVPVSLILWVLRRDPLALGASPDDPTFWRLAARRPGKPLYRRPFAYERHPLPAGSRRQPRNVVWLLGWLAVLGLVDLATGAVLNVDDKPDTAAGNASTHTVLPDVAASDNEPWAQQLFDEIFQHYEGLRYDPFRGWIEPDFAGEYVNVTDGVRQSYEADFAPGVVPIEVSFYGGSAMFGTYQRDEHTIASELVRIAEADGIAVHATNYGQPAYLNWQELLALQEQVSLGEEPDLAVFYDGANDIYAQFTRTEPTDDPTHIHAREVEQALLDNGTAAAAGGEQHSALRRITDGYLAQSAVAELVRRVRGEEAAGPAFTLAWPNQSEHTTERGAAAAVVHGRGVEVAEKLAAGAGFETAFFWQPWIYSKTVVPGEENAYGSWATDPKAWTAASDAARTGLHDDVVDLSDLFDDLDDPIMYDYVHTNEQGAHLVAEAMYQQLKPRLLALQADQGATR